MGKMTAMITLTFFLIYIPITLVFLIDPDAGFTRPTAVLVTDSFTCCLAIIDPMVYILCHEKYRDGIKLIFKRGSPATIDSSNRTNSEFVSYKSTTNAIKTKIQ